MKKRFILIAFILLTSFCKAQQSANVIPPSPDAAALAIYGNIPVSTYTGVPNISIPIHTISYRDVQIPIDLSYHASGITMEQDASWVGLGWTLNVGGVITRTQRGGDDLQFSNDGYSNLGSPTVLGYRGYPYDTFDDVPDFLWDVCKDEVDPEPDIFYFNFLGRSGSFVLEKGQSPSLNYIVGTPLKMEKIDIRYDKTNFTWIIKTPDGYIYYFNTPEITETLHSKGAYGKGPERANFDVISHGFLSYNDISLSSWYLDKVVTPLGEEINYVYDVEDIAIAPGTKNSKYGSARISMTDYNFVALIPGSILLDRDCYVPPLATDVTKIFTNHIYLKEINHALGKITFNKSLREDMMPPFSGLGSYSYLTNSPYYLTWIYNQKGPQKLDNIIFQNKDGAIVKKFEFVYNYFNGNVNASNKYDYRRLKLEKVRECGGTSCNPYYQLYYEETFSLPSKYTNAQDFWGYYNGAHNNVSRVPFGTYLELTENKHYFLGDSDRQPNATYMKTGTLKKIEYPSGGTTEFDFEPHEYAAFGNDAFILTDFENNTPIPISGLVTTQNDAAAFQTVNFSLSQPTEIVVNSAMTYYASATTSDPCNVIDPGTIYLGNEVWYSIKNINATSHVTYHQMSDFLEFFSNNYNDHCLNTPITPDAIDPIRRKRETFVLSAGTYELKVYKRQGFNIEVNVQKIAIQPRTINQNAAGVVAKIAGGLRIKKITSKESSTATPLIKRYEYTFTKSTTQPRTSTGRLMLFPNYHVLHHCGGGNYPLGGIMGKSWTNTPLGTSASGSIVGYDKVIESEGESYENGYTEYYYNNQVEEALDLSTVFITGLPTRKRTSNGLLREIKHYNKDNELLSLETTTYGVPQFQKQIKGIACHHIIDIIRMPGQGSGSYTPDFSCNNKRQNVSQEYTVVSDRWVPEKKTSRLYKDATNYIETITDYVFDTQTHLQLKSEQTKSSKNETIKTEYLYPPDAAWIPTGMWQTKFMYNIPVQKKVLKNSVLLSTYKASYNALGNTYVLGQEENSIGSASLDILNTYNYAANGNVHGILNESGVQQSFQWGYTNAYPTVEIKNAKNTLSTTNTTGTVNGTLNMPSSSASVSFTTTGLGNIVLSIMANPGSTYAISYSLSGPTNRTGILCASRTSTTCSYPESVSLTSMAAGTYTLSISLYSGSSSYKGTTYSYQGNQTVTTGIKEFFYQGFEEETSAATATPFAGKKYYNGDYTVPFTTPNARSYTVNYRYLDGGIWKNKTKTFTSNMSLTEGSAIDEVRVYPSDALMTTYTYNPLIGMTSQTDPSGKTMMYEYDGFGRLILVRDQDKNIVKKICYNYNGQTENCVQYLNEDKSGNYIRNNCGTGFTGGSVYVSIPPGMFTSTVSVADANNQATAYGQTQANASGACTHNASCSFTMSSGYTSPTNNINDNGSMVSFYLVFIPSATMQPGSSYKVATINGTCRPSTTRIINTTAGGRTWTISINSSGEMWWQLSSSSPALTAGSSMGTSTLQYNK